MESGPTVYKKSVLCAFSNSCSVNFAVLENISTKFMMYFLLSIAGHL